MTNHVTEANFEQEVLQADGLVIVDFWADWCTPCHAVAPVLERIAAEHELKLVKIDYDQEQHLAEHYGVPVDPEHDPLRGRRTQSADDRRAAQERPRTRPRNRGPTDTARMKARTPAQRTGRGRSPDCCADAELAR